MSALINREVTCTGVIMNLVRRIKERVEDGDNELAMLDDVGRMFRDGIEAIQARKAELNGPSEVELEALANQGINITEIPRHYSPLSGLAELDIDE